MNVDEEEEPPLLVDVEGEANGEEPSIIKVPITIVTGKCTALALPKLKAFTHIL